MERTKTTAIRACASLVAALAFPAAHADVHSSVTVGQIQGQIIDLTPDDGQQAEWYFATDNGGSNVSLRLNNETPSHDAAAEGWFGPVSVSDARSGASGHMEVQSQGMSLSGSAATAGTSYDGMAGTDVGQWWPEPGGQGLYLAPHSELTLTLPYEMTVGLDTLGCATGCQSAGAGVEFGSAMGIKETLLLDSTAATTLTESKTGSLTFTLRNDGDQWMDDFFFVQAYASGGYDLPTAPVPEPATNAMLALGLAICGAAAVKHGRKA